jgi:hypothetical protein
MYGIGAGPRETSKAANALNARAPRLPALILMTDAVRLPTRLRRFAPYQGSAVIVRHTRQRCVPIWLSG